MEYELKHYYRVKYALVCARQSFLKDPPKDDYEEYARENLGFYSFIVFSIIPSSSLPVRFTMISGSSFIPRLTQLTSAPINT